MRTGFLLPVASLLVAGFLTTLSGQNPVRISPVGPATETTGLNIATYNWPVGRGLVPLEAEIRTEENDGMWETALYVSGDSLHFDFEIPAGLVVAEDRGTTSCRLISRSMPDNSLEIFLFEGGTFLPAVNDATLRGYQLGLEKRYQDRVIIDEEVQRIPRKTFSVLGNQWGIVRYRLNDADSGESLAEFFVPLSSRLLVLRLRGMESFVDAMVPRIKRSLSTFSLQN